MDGQNLAGTFLTALLGGSGLDEQGCDGPVKDGINRLEKHLNKRAHEM